MCSYVLVYVLCVLYLHCMFVYVQHVLIFSIFPIFPYVLRVPTCGEACIRWRCTRAAPGERPARGWIREAVTVEREPGHFTLRAKDMKATRFDPCEYVFELRYNGLVVVLREAKVLGEHAAPLHQIAWGIVDLGRILPPRMAVLPMPA